MKQIKDIKPIENYFLVEFTCGEWAKIYQFGKDLYTVTSDNLHKSTLSELKVDFKFYFRGEKSLKQIKEKWIQ